MSTTEPILFIPGMNSDSWKDLDEPKDNDENPPSAYDDPMWKSLLGFDPMEALK